ncbi:L-histidine N(alpha)-methyltransferase [Novosphingobium mangrovi (ex Hu et al. 2023)]|uniref:L-histidine N(Alpha)-methyltransferase n=1 Tax=Novosphingobium mangrovi (ex Hu et al. 2023) TaxID=2930094 RepID=A0ABT0AH12_9SPHN|nr:L-histidine N(alpha)-methyltransferase [Novosphingobium mangrovi (ex Hu et al. 2023)]MCJ1962477.1 L-histidine N(alpha)-methyltransferase [Novosphingobium mangrovi (ex Hu et al. 2023)]
MATSPLDAPRQSRPPCFDPAFRADVLSGLGGRAKSIPARWLYDETGSEIFEAITQAPEYYPTRTETALLRAHSADVVRQSGADAPVVEFGSGSSLKTRILLEHMPKTTYVPIDICGEFMDAACAELGARFPGLEILPVEGDFMQEVALPSCVKSSDRESPEVLGFFPGSTIGNLLHAEALDMLRAMRRTLGEGAWLLIGMDRAKEPDRLIAAYDDAQGVTARFNLNLLTRINRELEGSIPLDGFRHLALWNEERSRIEMHLEALRDVRFEVAGRPFTMGHGETIHTENCHKYTPQGMEDLLAAGGWATQCHWSDADGDYSLLLARACDQERG